MNNNHDVPVSPMLALARRPASLQSRDSRDNQESTVLGPRFRTDWNLGAGSKSSQSRAVKKRRVHAGKNAVAEIFPLKVDSRGRVQGLVQTGPVNTKKVKS